MGYSRSAVSVIRIQSELTEVAAGRECRWHRPLGDAQNWAYKVRQAFRVARRFPERFPGLATYGERFIIEVVDDHTVQARFLPQWAGQAAPEVAAPAELPPLPTQRAARTIVGVTTLTGIIDQWIKSQPSTDPLHFPQAALSREDLLRLYSWGQSRRPAWGIVKPRGTESITLMVEQGDGDFEFWTPQTGDGS